MVLVGRLFLTMARRKPVGLERVKTYISPENNQGIWHGAGVKAAFVETFSKKKTKRYWKPNIHEREYYSDLLDETLRYTFSTKAMRQIDYMGGFDNYILRTPDSELVSNAAISLKCKMETVQRMLQVGDKTLAEIKEEIRPVRHSKHKFVPREYTNRFYFDWYGVTRHVVYC